MVSFTATDLLPTNQLLLEALMRRRGSINRAVALTVPTVLRGRNLICGDIATLPLLATLGDNRPVDNALLRQIDTNVANSVVLAMTIEDLLFDAVAWWRVTEFGPDGYPAAATRYDPVSVSLTPPSDYREGFLPSDIATHGAVWMAGERVDAGDYIRFDSPNPALLVVGQPAISRALALDDLAAMYTENPEMRGFFTSRPGDPPPDETKVQKFLDDWSTGRAESPYGYVDGLDYKQIQVTSPAEMMLIPQQQRASLEIINAMGLDPEDFGINVTSRTYANAVDRRKDRVNDTLSPYMQAVTGRLSMDDVTPYDVAARFDLDDFLKADPLTRAQVAQIYATIGVTDPAEIRHEEGRPPRTVAAAPLQPLRVPSMLGSTTEQIEA